MPEMISASIGAQLSRGESALTLFVCCVGIAVYSLVGVRRVQSRTRAGVLIAFSGTILLTRVVGATARWCDVEVRFQALALAFFGLTNGVLWPPWVLFRVAIPGATGAARLFPFMLCLGGPLLIWIGVTSLQIAIRLWPT